MKSKHKQDGNYLRDQRGLVSFMVTLIMMMVISLIVIGFTQATNRARREAVDRQLSTQAFYAAESGVNDAATTIKTAISNGTTVAQQDECDEPSGAYPNFPVGTSTDVAVTCIMVNTNPEDIRVSAAQNSSTIVRIDSATDSGNPSNLTQLTFDWSAADGKSADPADCTMALGSFAPDAGACGYGLLRVDLMQVNLASSAPKPADALAEKTTTFYFQPINTGSTKVLNNASRASKAFIVGAVCDATTRMCRSTLDLTQSWGTKEFYARLSTMYRDAPTVIIDGANNGGGLAGNAHFVGAQAVIDSTGRARDVLRRIQVRLPLIPGSDGMVPPAAVQSGDSICKRFTVWPGGVDNDECTP